MFGGPAIQQNTTVFSARYAFQTTITPNAVQCASRALITYSTSNVSGITYNLGALSGTGWVPVGRWKMERAMQVSNVGTSNGTVY